MFTERVGSFLAANRDHLVQRLTRAGAGPNFLTLVGLLITVAAAVDLARGRFLWAGGLLIAAGIFDVLDGSVARATGNVTPFGAFLDSVVDRYSDSLLFLGLFLFFVFRLDHLYAVLVFIVLTGTFVVSYTRARGENYVDSLRIGLLKRPERLMLLIFGCLSGRIEAALWVMAVLTHFTVAQRIYWVRSHLEGRLPDEGGGGGEVAVAGGFTRRRLLIDYRRGSWQYYVFMGVLVLLILLLAAAIS